MMSDIIDHTSTANTVVGISSVESKNDDTKKFDEEKSIVKIERPKSRRRKKNKQNVVKFFAGNSCRYPVVRDAVAKIGWKVVDENASEKAKNSCNIIWVDTSNINDYFATIQPWQRINHFPGMTNIARKTRLAEHLDSMKKQFRKDYSFYPTTYVLPRDKHNMKRYFEPGGKSKTTYIVKPDGGCQGRGIFLTKKWDAIDELSSTHVAQRYISDPLLIDNKKFDLRIYVLITSCDPLRIYLFQDGLVRLCTQDFSKPKSSNLDNTCMHLSNYSINKRSDDFNGSEDVTGSSGSKRSVKWFLSWLADKKGKDVADMLWCKIGHICAKTILCIEPILQREYKTIFGLDVQSSMASTMETDVKKEEFGSIAKPYININDNKSSVKDIHTSDLKQPIKDNEGDQTKKKDEKHIIGSRSLAILGFDVMIDSKMKPHLIEVNHLPSFATDSALDESIKSRVVLQALSTIQAAGSDQQSHETNVKKIREKRLFKGSMFGMTNTHEKKYELEERRDKVKDVTMLSSTHIRKREKNLDKQNNDINVEEFVTEIYSIHAPEKIDKVGILLQKYKGHEDWLVKKLKEKYCTNTIPDTVDSTKQHTKNEKKNDFINTDSICGMANGGQDDDDNQEGCFSENDSFQEDSHSEEGDNSSQSFDQNMIYEDEVLIEKGDYDRIYPPKRGKYKSPSYEKMRKHASAEDYKQQMRLVCPLWQLRKYERHDENVTTVTEVKQEIPKLEKTNVGYSSRGDWLVHGNVHRKSEPIPTKIIPLPSQKQLEAAERLSRGFSVENSVLISEEEAANVNENDFITRLSLAEQVGKEIRKKNEEKFIPRSQLNLNPINIAFDVPSSSRERPSSASERCYVDFTGRKLGYR